MPDEGVGIQWGLFNPGTLVPSQSARINQLAGLSDSVSDCVSLMTV